MASRPAVVSEKDGLSEETNISQRSPRYGELEETKSAWASLGLTMSSFKRQEDGENTTDKLDKSLKKRHLHMIAIGGSIGAGLFVSSGTALNNGGPATLVVDFTLIGMMMFNVVYALGELAVMYPVSGGFYTYSTRFVDPSWGFAMGWNYVFQWSIALPLELVIAALTVGYWDSHTNVAVWITAFLALLVIISIFGVRGYGEGEFWISLIKLSTVVIFMVIALVLVCGGGPAGGKYDEYWGARLWYDPSPFKNGFKGLCSVFVMAAFSFSGSELVGLAAAESENPVKSLPGAVKQVFWRVTLFYILSLLFIGLLVSAKDPRLLGSGSLFNVAASPFVLVVKDAGLRGLDSVINAVILLSIMSIGLSGIYGGSRTLTALAEQGYAPGIFTYIDRAGRPLPSTIAILCTGLVGYTSLSATAPLVFEWLQALSGLASLFTWGSICLAHIRFRQAWHYQGHTVDEIPFRAAFGIWGSVFGLGFIILVILAQFYTSLFPPDGSSPCAETFFKSSLALPVVIVFYVCGYLWKRKTWLSIEEIDVDSGRRELDWDLIRQQNAEKAAWPIWKRVADKFI